VPQVRRDQSDEGVLPLLRNNSEEELSDRVLLLTGVPGIGKTTVIPSGTSRSD
jgi:putative protein kinase ArgK-like GTPase of G3E family